MSAVAQCESLRYKLLGGLAVRRYVYSYNCIAALVLSWLLLCVKSKDSLLPSPPSAAYGVLRFVMESNAKGCEVVISGKLRAARAKSMKFTEGFMIHSGQPARDFVDEAVRHVMLRQGVLGIKVKM